VPETRAARAELPSYLPVLAALADLELEIAEQTPAGWPVVPAAGARVALDLSGAIDVPAERARLSRSVEAQRKELAQVRAKLGNAGFLAKAPATVVETMRARESAATAELERLGGLLDALPAA